MTHKGKRGQNASIENLGIKDATINWNLSSDELAQISIEKGLATETSSGAITVDTGEFTGRSPKDRFIVKDDITRDLVWWGNVNIPFEQEKFDQLYDKVTDYLSGKELYVRDAFACSDPKYKMKLRVVNEIPWGNLFVHNMFLRPSDDEFDNFEPEWTVISASKLMANP